MKKLKLLLALFALLVGTTASWAKTDVTATYLKDADLSSLEGWVNPGKTDWKTDGAVNVVEFWNWSDQFSFTQVAKLPAGYYRLAVNAFYRNSWGGDGTNNNMAWILAGSKTQNVIALNSMSDLAGYAGSNDLYRAATAFSQGKFSNEFDFNVTGEGTTEVEIGFKGTCPNGGWCILGPVTLYEYTAADYIEDYRAKVDIATPLLSEKMNAGVLQALQTAIVEESTLVSVDDVLNAVSTLTTAINNANNSIALYGSLKSAIDAYDANYALLDADGKAAADAAGANAAKEAYTNGTATDGATEKASLNAAFNEGVLATKQPGNGLDMTVYIVNPDFNSGNTDGWTKETPYGGNCAIQGGSRMEYWAGNASNRANASFNIYQELTNLPAGVYTISADMYNSLNDENGDYTEFSPTCGVYGLSANEKVALVTEEGTTLKPYTTDEVFVVSGKMTIGTKNTTTPMAARWFVFDNVKLTYVRQMTNEEIDTYVMADYNKALAAAKAVVEGTIPTTAWTNLQSVITNNDLADGTSSEYYAASTALSKAADAAMSLVAPYTLWKALKPQADALVAVSTSNTGENATLASAISEQNIAVEDAITSDAITNATSTLKAAMVTYVTTAEPINDECFDLTFMIVNPHFTEGTGDNPTGWTVNYPAAPEGQWGGARELRLSTHNFEAYHKQFTLSQTIPSLSKGTYKVTLQGFARHDGNDKDKTNLFCGIVNQPIKDIKDEYSTKPLTSGKPAMGDENGESSYTLNEQTVYQPNGMSGSYYFFQEENPATGQPFYTSEVQTFIKSDGDLAIGFKCETWSDWVIWDNFHLYYYGSAIAVTIDEDAVSSVYEENIENANITLKRTFSAGKWNTIALPFDLTDAETKAAFGDVVVATYSETDDGRNDSKVTFDIADDASITANTPVLLMTSTDKTTFTFNGKTIKAGEAKVEGGAHFDFVGTYAASTIIAKGDYFIRDKQLWQSKGETTIKGTRAYFKAKTEGAQARIADLRIGESETTGIVSVDNGVKTIENATFDLQGRKVANVKKGLYIKNSKKVVVR